MRIYMLLFISLTPFLPAAAQQQIFDQNDEEVFTVVEDMPIPWLYKTECIDVPTAQKSDCYLRALNHWLSGQLRYPESAVRNKTEGTVIVRFIIDRTGEIREAEVLKDIGDGCGQAALDAILNMPRWIPGRQRGVPVHVRYTMPVRFELQR